MGTIVGNLLRSATKAVKQNLPALAGTAANFFVPGSGNMIKGVVQKITGGIKPASGGVTQSQDVPLKKIASQSAVKSVVKIVSGKTIRGSLPISQTSPTSSNMNAIKESAGKVTQPAKGLTIESKKPDSKFMKFVKANVWLIVGIAIGVLAVIGIIIYAVKGSGNSKSRPKKRRKATGSAYDAKVRSLMKARRARRLKAKTKQAA